MTNAIFTTPQPVGLQAPLDRADARRWTTVPTSSHAPWCDPRSHALWDEEQRDAGEESYCIGDYVTATLPDGQEVAGYWRQPDSGLVFAVDSPIDTEFPPHGMRELLTALKGASNPLADGLRALFTRALAELQ